jgi:hypothetical protein
MVSKSEKLLNAEIDELSRHLPAWVLGGLVNDHGVHLSIECLRSVSQIAADLKASNIIGEIGRGNRGSVEIHFNEASGRPMIIKVSNAGNVSRTPVRITIVNDDVKS